MTIFFGKFDVELFKSLDIIACNSLAIFTSVWSPSIPVFPGFKVTSNYSWTTQLFFKGSKLVPPAADVLENTPANSVWFSLIIWLQTIGKVEAKNETN